jgi:RHS repeat-associated protein
MIPTSVGPIQTLGYDYAKGMPTSTTYNSASLAAMAYDPTSWALTQISYANGASTGFTYWDDHSRLKTMSMGIPGQVSKVWTYGYNSRGDVTTDGEDYYSYDKLSRLTQAFIRDPWDASGGTGATGVWQQFGYDAFGNRSVLASWTATNWTAGALPPATPTTTVTAKAQSYAMTAAEITTMGATNRLPSTIGGVATGAAYDNQGNLTQIYGTLGQTTTQVTMAYDALARVTSLGDSKNATSQAYLYDDEGLRIKIVDSKTSVTTYNIYNEARQIVATYTKTGTGSLTWKKDIVYVGSKEMAEVGTTGTSVTLTDHLGTPRYVWSGSGVPLKQKFLPFGESLAPPSVASGIGKGFTNHEQTDPSGLIYMQARYYLPQYGRFGSPDPARDQHFEATQSWNIYSYVRNMPTISTDPTGMLLANPSASPEPTGNPDTPTAQPAPVESGPGIPNPAQTIAKDAEKRAQTNTPAPLPALPSTPALDTSPLPSLPPTNPVTNGIGVPPAGELGSLGNVPIGGWHNLRSNGTTHAGADLTAPLGTAIYAPISGNVLYSGFKNSIAGGTVTIFNSNSNTQVSAKHLMANFGMCTFSLSGGLTYSFRSGTGFVQTGQFVQQGQQIGIQGNTGNASWTNAAPARQHVHFEVHVGGRSVDPVRWLNGVPQ